MELIIAVLVGFGIGLVLATIGAGGSVLAVPALIFIGDLKVQEATGTALIIVASSAALGFVLTASAGRSHPKVGLALGATGIVGGLVGSWAHNLAREEIILVLLAMVMLLAAAIVYLRIPKEEAVGNPKLEAIRTWWPKVLLSGAALGTLTGFFGVGGGFLILPVLVLLLGLPMRLAVGTSLLVITINSVSGIVGHVIFGEVNLGDGTPMLAGALVGTIAGTCVGARVRERRLRTMFATLLCGVAIFMLVDVIGGLGS